MAGNLVPRTDGATSLGTADKEYSAIYAKTIGGTLADILAKKDSPALTGTPTAPTAAAGTATTQIATTAFVNNAVSTKADAATTLAGYGITDAAPLDSPTLTGIPTSTTPANTDNSTKIATTAFVKTIRTGTITLDSTYFSQGEGLWYRVGNVVQVMLKDCIATGVTPSERNRWAAGIPNTKDTFYFNLYTYSGAVIRCCAQDSYLTALYKEFPSSSEAMHTTFTYITSED